MSKVSIIIPTNNRSNFLRQTVESVLAQTYTDFELIVVDDGSVDDTERVMDRFDDSRITYLYQENAGRSVARNYGLSHASGDYIALLDDDDLYLPDKLTVQVAFLNRHLKIGLVSSGAQIIAHDGVLLRTWKTWEEQPQLTLSKCLYACPLMTCSVLFRRQWLDALDHWFDPSLEPAEDTDFWIRLLLAGCQMSWVEELVAMYRWHENNSQQDKNRYYQSFLSLYDKLFSQPSLPEILRTEQPKLYTIRHTVGACEAYQDNDFDQAQSRLAMINEWHQKTTEDLYAIVAKTIAGFTYSNVYPDSEKFIDLIFNHLPESLSNLARYRRYTHACFYMKRVFEAGNKTETVNLSDWVKGVTYDPTWLTNRGVWSLLVRRSLATIGGN